MRIDKEHATTILLAEAAQAQDSETLDPWENAVVQLSTACEGTSKTHIAFLGTAILAKAVDLRADAFSVKAGASTPGAYSARGLGHGVLVPNAAKLGIDLGVTGREPLNNQPYFRIQRATEEEILPLVQDPAPVRVLLDVLKQIDGIKDNVEARRALRAFVRVRRRYLPEYPTLSGETGAFTVHEFTHLVASFVARESEGGKRAQAVTAGIFDAALGEARIVSGRINDPDRNLPGDVGVRSMVDPAKWERVVEVRDKAVSASDLLLFAQKAAQYGVHYAGFVAVAGGQGVIEEGEAVSWADENRVCLRVYWSWKQLFREAIFWSGKRPGAVIERAVERIRKRLVEVEASVDAVEQWIEAVEEGS